MRPVDVKDLPAGLVLKDDDREYILIGWSSVHRAIETISWNGHGNTTYMFEEKYFRKHFGYDLDPSKAQSIREILETDPATAQLSETALRRLETSLEMFALDLLNKQKTPWPELEKVADPADPEPALRMKYYPPEDQIYGTERCMACGGIHEGRYGLPCPKMVAK